MTIYIKGLCIDSTVTLDHCCIFDSLPTFHQLFFNVLENNGENQQYIIEINQICKYCCRGILSFRIDNPRKFDHLGVWRTDDTNVGLGNIDVVHCGLTLG